MEAGQPSTRIVRFPSGEELTVEQADSERFVFAAGSEPDTIFAFDRESAEGELERWAQDHERSDSLARALEAADRLPENPNAGLDEDAERAKVEELNARLLEFSTRAGIPMEAPEFIQKAHEAGVFDSAMLYRQPYYGSPAVGLSTSCADVRPHLPTGALSVRTSGFNVVLLYDQPNYGPAIARRTPILSLVGIAAVPLCPRPILSVLFN